MSSLDLDSPEYINAFLKVIGGSEVPPLAQQLSKTLKKTQTPSFNDESFNEPITLLNPEADDFTLPARGENSQLGIRAEIGSFVCQADTANKPRPESDYLDDAQIIARLADNSNLKLEDSRFSPSSPVGRQSPFLHILRQAPPPARDTNYSAPRLAMTPTQVSLLQKMNAMNIRTGHDFKDIVINKFKAEQASRNPAPAQSLPPVDTESPVPTNVAISDIAIAAEDVTEAVMESQEETGDVIKNEHEETAFQNGAEQRIESELLGSDGDTDTYVEVGLPSNTPSSPKVSFPKYEEENLDPVLEKVVSDSDDSDAGVETAQATISTDIATKPHTQKGPAEAQLQEAAQHLANKLKDLACDDKEDRTDLVHFSAWGNPQERSTPKSRVRRVLLRNLPASADFTLVQSLVHGGALECMTLSNADPVKGTCVAHVTFTSGDAADQYCAKYPRGFEFRYNNKKCTMLVEKGRDVDVVSGRLQVALDCGASRVLKVSGVDDDWTMGALQRIARGKARRVENITDTWRSETRTVIFRFTSIADAVDFKGELTRNPEWSEDCQIEFAEDPCARRTSIRLE